MTSLSDAKITKKTRVTIWQSLRTTVPITFLIPLITSAGLLFFLVNQNIKEIAKKDFKADIEIIKQAINEELSDYFKQDNRTNKDAISLILRNRKISDELDDIFKSHIEYSIFIVDESRNLIPASIKHKKILKPRN